MIEMQCFCFVFTFVAQSLYKQQKCEHVRDYSVQQVSPKCHVRACFSQCSLEDSLPVMSVLALSQWLLFKVLSGNVHMQIHTQTQSMTVTVQAANVAKLLIPCCLFVLKVTHETFFFFTIDFVLSKHVYTFCSEMSKKNYLQLLDGERKCPSL